MSSLSTTCILFLHGFASSSQGFKAQYLRRRFSEKPGVRFYAPDFNPTPVDFKHMTVTGMINRLRQFIIERQITRYHLIGSSMGALTGLHYAHRYGGVTRMLLLAPALTYLTDRMADEAAWRKAGTARFEHFAFERSLPVRYDLQEDGRLFYHTPPPPPTPIRILHGRFDDVIPIDRSRDYATTYPDQVQLVTLESNHRLNGQIELIWQNVTEFLLNNYGGDNE